MAQQSARISCRMPPIENGEELASEQRVKAGEVCGKALGGWGSTHPMLSASSGQQIRGSRFPSIQ